MGVSISLDGESITPGWRSMMHQLLLDRFGSSMFRLDKSDIPTLEELRDTQRKGEVDPPFDYSEDIAESFDKIIDRLKENGTAVIECVC